MFFVHLVGFGVFFFFFFFSLLRGLLDFSSPNQGLNQGPPQWKCGVLTTGPPRNPHHLLFLITICIDGSFFVFVSVFSIIAFWLCSKRSHHSFQRWMPCLSTGRIWFNKKSYLHTFYFQHFLLLPFTDMLQSEVYAEFTAVSFHKAIMITFII